PGPVPLLGEDDDGGRAGRRGDGAEGFGGPRLRPDGRPPEVEHDDVRPRRRHLARRRLARRRAEEAEAGAPAHHRFQARPRLGAGGDHEDVRHGAASPARRRKRSTATLGTARASPPWIMALTPSTRPGSSASGPPEFPGARRRSATSQAPSGSSRSAGSRWRTPTESAPGIPNGWPTARTS